MNLRKELSIKRSQIRINHFTGNNRRALKHKIELRKEQLEPTKEAVRFTGYVALTVAVTPIAFPIIGYKVYKVRKEMKELGQI